MDRRRRWWLIAAAVAVTSLVAIWLLLPRLISLVVNTRLPHELGPHATLLALYPRVPPSSLHPISLDIDPALARAIAMQALDRWIPPSVIRDGLGAVGNLRGEGQVAIPWVVVARTGVAPPRLSVSLTPAQADALLAGTAHGSLAGLPVRPTIAGLELAALPDDDAIRSFRVEASGALRLGDQGMTITVPVRRLVARIGLEFIPAATGWELTVRVVIDTLDAPLPPLPGVDTTDWRRLLANWIEGRLADRLAGRTLPSWFPTDVQVSAVVR